MNQYNIVKQHPLFSGWMERAWQATYNLPKDFSLTPSYLRTNLTTAFDIQSEMFIDLLHQNNPRKLVTKANDQYRAEREVVKRILDQNIDPEKTRRFSAEIKNDTRANIIKYAFRIDTERVKIIVQKDSASHVLYHYENGQWTLGILPDLAGLYFGLAYTACKTHPLGSDRKNFFGFPIIGASLDFLTGEAITISRRNWTSFIYKKLLGTHKDAKSLAFKFVQGEVDPLLDALSKVTDENLYSAIIFSNYSLPPYEE